MLQKLAIHVEKKQEDSDKQIQDLSEDQIQSTPANIEGLQNLPNKNGEPNEEVYTHNDPNDQNQLASSKIPSQVVDGNTHIHQNVQNDSPIGQNMPIQCKLEQENGLDLVQPAVNDTDAQ